MMKNTQHAMAALLLAATMVPSTPAAEQVAKDLPVIKTFEITPEIAAPGSEMTLRWEVEGATKVELKQVNRGAEVNEPVQPDLKRLQPGPTEFKGTRTMRSLFNSTYAMTAKNASGTVRRVARLRLGIPVEPYETVPGLQPGVQEYDCENHFRELDYVLKPTRVVPTLDLELPSGHKPKYYQAYLKVPKDGIYQFQITVGEGSYSDALFYFCCTRAALQHGCSIDISPKELKRQGPRYYGSGGIKPARDIKMLKKGWYPIRVSIQSEEKGAPTKRLTLLWGELGGALHAVRADECGYVPPEMVEKLKDFYPVTWRRVEPPARFHDGSYAQTWEPEQPLTFKRTLYVDAAAGSDSNNGSENAPFQTITKAAQMAQPGERVLVRKGVYRESVVVPRGGTGVNAFISYEGEPGAVVRGSRVLTGWTKVADRNNVWKTSMAQLAPDEENPFLLKCWPDDVRHRQQSGRKLYPYRGMLFRDGQRLFILDDFKGFSWMSRRQRRTQGAQFYVDRDHKDIYIYASDGKDPNDCLMEATFCTSVFGPRRQGIGFIRVKGLTFEHAGSTIGFPQQGGVTTWCGHHWIIEDNVIRHCYGNGLDCGIRSEWLALPPVAGYHIVRRNLFTDCGQNGIVSLGATARLNNHTNYDFQQLILDNVILNTSFGPFPPMTEEAGIKPHLFKDSLIRGNFIAGLGKLARTAIWCDCRHINHRVSENICIHPAAGVYIESHPRGHGIYANNLFLGPIKYNTYSHILHNLATGFGKPWSGPVPYVHTDLRNNALTKKDFKAPKPDHDTVAEYNIGGALQATVDPETLDLVVELTQAVEPVPRDELCEYDYSGAKRGEMTLPGPFDKIEVGKPIRIPLLPEWARDNPSIQARAREALAE